MKLIVDISEEDYIKANAGILGSLGDIIANGKPYEERPQSDLISRNALKAEVALMFGDKTHITESVCELIDNASTDRPQDKWIDRSEEGYVECPICGCLTNCEDNIDELNYCWNCGAKMQNSDAEK